MINKSILILGKPQSGKTTFLTQFYSRLIKNKSEIKLYESVNDLSPITEARDRLANGLEPEPTSSLKYVELILPVIVRGNRIDINYPDSAGEQVSRIIENRCPDDNWLKALNESENWLLFMRPSNTKATKDLSNTTFEKENPLIKADTSTVDAEISDQSFLIELLQILLEKKGHDFHQKVNSVDLNVVLTCWDELDTDVSPAVRLSHDMPLVSNFISTNWGKDHFHVFGLSSQGFSLDNEIAKNKYLDEGPENFGYLIMPDGARITDLTMLISEIL